MSSGILTLFGEEELQPEQINAVGKSRAVPKEKKEKKEKAPPKKKEPKPKDDKKAEEEPAEEAPKKKEEVLKDWNAEKQYYSIGEVAALFKVATSHIRFWTNEFKLKVRTTRKGDRLFSPENIKELRAIYDLVKDRGYTIAGAKAKLKSNKKASV
jgi:hypothetical protein